jgi:hypothetical protein
LWQLSRGAARKMPGLQVAGGGESSGAPQDDRRISNVPLAAARGRQSVWSCRATRGGHRQSLENAIFTCSRRDSYRGQCGGRRFADITTLHMRHDSCQLPSSFVRLTLLFSPSVLIRLSLGYVSLFTLVSHLTEQESKHPQCLVRIVAQEVCGPTPPTRCMHHWPVHAFIVGEGRRW